MDGAVTGVTDSCLSKQVSPDAAIDPARRRGVVAPDGETKGCVVTVRPGVLAAWRPAGHGQNNSCTRERQIGVAGRWGGVTLWANSQWARPKEGKGVRRPHRTGWPSSPDLVHLPPPDFTPLLQSSTALVPSLPTTTIPQAATAMHRATPSASTTASSNAHRSRRTSVYPPPLDIASWPPSSHSLFTDV